MNKAAAKLTYKLVSVASLNTIIMINAFLKTLSLKAPKNWVKNKGKNFLFFKSDAVWPSIQQSPIDF